MDDLEHTYRGVRATPFSPVDMQLPSRGQCKHLAIRVLDELRDSGLRCRCGGCIKGGWRGGLQICCSQSLTIWSLTAWSLALSRQVDLSARSKPHGHLSSVVRPAECFDLSYAQGGNSCPGKVAVSYVMLACDTKQRISAPLQFC